MDERTLTNGLFHRSFLHQTLCLRIQQRVFLMRF